MFEYYQRVQLLCKLQTDIEVQGEHSSHGNIWKTSKTSVITKNTEGTRSKVTNVMSFKHLLEKHMFISHTQYVKEAKVFESC